MKTTKRFDEAVKKLYISFHNGTLNAMDCSACAVGNICNGDSNWKNNMDDYRILEELTDFDKLNDIKNYFDSGYSAKELANIESIFMFGFDVKQESFYFIERYPHDNYTAMISVIEYLCELDNIPNIMDYTKLFETENELPKYQLT